MHASSERRESDPWYKIGHTPNMIQRVGYRIHIVAGAGSGEACRFPMHAWLSKTQYITVGLTLLLIASWRRNVHNYIFGCIIIIWFGKGALLHHIPTSVDWKLTIHLVTYYVGWHTLGRCDIMPPNPVHICSPLVSTSCSRCKTAIWVALHMMTWADVLVPHHNVGVRVNIGQRSGPSKLTAEPSNCSLKVFATKITFHNMMQFQFRLSSNYGLLCSCCSHA